MIAFLAFFVAVFAASNSFILEKRIKKLEDIHDGHPELKKK